VLHLKQHFVTAATTVYIYIRHTHIKMHTYVINVHLQRYIQKFISVTFKYLSLFQSSFCNKSDFPTHIINELNPVITSVTRRALRTWENFLGKRTPKKESALQTEQTPEAQGGEHHWRNARGKLQIAGRKRNCLPREKKKKIRAMRRKTNMLCLISVVSFLPGRPPAPVLSQASCKWQECYRWSSNSTHAVLSA